MSKKKNVPKKVKKNIKSGKKKLPKAKVTKSVKKLAPKPPRPAGGKISKPMKSTKKTGHSNKPKAKKVVKPLKKVVKPLVVKKTLKPIKIVKSTLPVGGKSIAKVEIIKSKGILKPLKEEKIVKLAVKPARLPAGKAGPTGGSIEKVKIVPVKKDKKPRGKGGRKPKPKDGDNDEPEIVHDELIEQLIQSTKRKKHGPKVPKILKTFVNPMTSLTVAPSESAGKKGGSIPKKEPKGKFELEYVIRTSAGILYEFITSPSGLSEWFADDVNIRDGVFTFFWDGSEQKAKLLGFKDDKFIRLSWLDKPEGMYFEFRIEKDDLTGDISLIIIDFADEAADMQTSKLLWDSQVNKLLGVLGSN